MSCSERKKEIRQRRHRKKKMAIFARKVKSATAYPKFVFGFFGIMSLGILLFIIPRFRAIFESFGAKLPPLTLALMNVSDFVRS